MLLLLALAGCATTPAQPEAEYKPTGEVRYHDRIATFDATHVRAPNCNLKRRDDGTWGGTLSDRPIDVSVTAVALRGVDFILSRAEAAPGKSVVTGQLQGRMFRFEWDSDQMAVRTGGSSLASTGAGGSGVSANFRGRVVGEKSSRFGPLGDVQLLGEASEENAPWPQVAFALMAVFY
jgi:hypothetical protein